ncbi:uncharacterized protein BP01DRAFT_353538 [Aspergillus saccharolyticus JOP 1030-1]|uniref:Uncharacterized protein n=1 Tax=Aspergillus saccharolyticus JOP 1030-1 TaxID=1450539 RepID=A0A319APR0_9EURO|nr:hypothetical protein BP01DRAFT_353538 [Aspergillus saccharolyticus JOP 1030-1]PYH48392.1 hypothetical protein BP01DRAFT_353538 [Aspergillus saccharolyticus JOP 1030-1]
MRSGNFVFSSILHSLPCCSSSSSASPFTFTSLGKNNTLSHLPAFPLTLPSCILYFPSPTTIALRLSKIPIYSPT